MSVRVSRHCTGAEGAETTIVWFVKKARLYGGLSVVPAVCTTGKSISICNFARGCGMATDADAIMCGKAIDNAILAIFFATSTTFSILSLCATVSWLMVGPSRPQAALSQTLNMSTTRHTTSGNSGQSCCWKRSSTAPTLFASLSKIELSYWPRTP